MFFLILASLTLPVGGNGGGGGGAEDIIKKRGNGNGAVRPVLSLGEMELAPSQLPRTFLYPLIFFPPFFCKN
jgi:hypothetical protein